MFKPLAEKRWAELLVQEDCEILFLLVYRELFELSLLRLLLYRREQSALDPLLSFHTRIRFHFKRLAKDEAVAILRSALRSTDLQIRLGAIQVAPSVGTEYVIDILSEFAARRRSSEYPYAKGIIDAYRKLF